MWKQISQQISQVTGKPFTLEEKRSVGGGCINQSYQLIGDNQSYFVKVNNANSLEMFLSEANGLKQILETQSICAPRPICWGSVDNHSYLVLEWLEFARGGNHQAWFKMGQQLAQMHSYKGASEFGWQQNNTIGSTPQINTWMANWADFFAEHRIGYQIKLARRKGGSFPNPELVIPKVKEFLQDRNPLPSLVHGDLWSGNAAITVEGNPVILDPASYYADHEVDLAMTELFGGFPAAFYEGYNQVLPLEAGYQQRKTLYNLYHILNHFNLFGGGYGSQASRMLQQILF